MKKRYFNTLVAVAILLALWGTITYLDKRQSKQASKVESTPEEKILSVESNHIRSITLKPRDGEAVVLNREGETWGITRPRKLAADQTNVSSFLSSLTSATVDQVVDANPANLKDFGLDSPGFTVEVTTDTKPEKFTLRLGDETPTSGGVYAQVGGSPRVITLASYMKSSLEKKLDDLRDKRALTLDADQLQKIEVQSKGKNYTLVKNPEGVWDLVLPPAVRADRMSVQGIIDQLRNLTMQTVVSDEKKITGQYGFSAPELRVTLSSAKGTQTITLGKKDKEGDRYFAMNSALEPIFTLSSSFLTQFQKDPSSLREKDLFSFSVYDAKRLEVDTPKGHRVFEKQQDKWKQTAPTSKEEPTDKVETLLNRLRDLRADTFPKETNLAALGLASAPYRFQVQFGDKNQTESVEAAKEKDHVYARRSTDPLPAELSKTALDDVEKALGDL
jgi:hypothetical protein